MSKPLKIEMQNYTVNFKDQEAARRFVMWYSHHAKVVADLTLSHGDSEEENSETLLGLAFLQRDLNTLINQACSFIG
ncbi:MAG: hypothetical protein B7Y05_02610 [Polynucleobacter sp. 24-46-87]|jgi:hypothetical protein|uniref:hypothetical protein n=1 Tax=Polynucleobacter sp. 39-46-10 TaxID=1970428 RepID=UPI000BC8DB94|nr:hypothetical protein [Polynucleobacter sp. 39-46-10]OZA15776.1 MAG: hypothetical protein B7Y05_02610 [Polynucleobacter sp. 24-46-87]OZA77873.1 MAG: hypothetical protein B7X71_03500 [Polynucleobacter sp. 39-46-10]